MKQAARSIAILVAAACAALSACDSPAAPEPVATLVIAPDTSLVRINTTTQLQATARTRDGKTLSGADIAWTTADQGIATVSRDGAVTAVSYGRTIVTATADGVAATAVVWVTGTPGVTIVSGQGVTDTISALLPAPVVVHVRDERGLPIPGANLRVSGRAAGFSAPLMQVRVGDYYTADWQTQADSLGTLTMQARMGQKAGPVTLEVRHFPFGGADTARFTVLAGQPALVQATPADSAVFLGRTLELRTAFLDRGGNKTSDRTATFAVVDGPVTVNALGVVGTTGYGTARVEARFGAAADTVRMVVVPQAALVAVSGFGGMALVNLDGSGLQVIPGHGRMPAWSPSGDRLVYQQYPEAGPLVTQTLGGAPSPLVAQATRGWHFWPQYSRDGEWVYYFSSARDEPQTIWRVRADGTGLEQISNALATRPFEGHPSPSPDGTRIAYFVGTFYEVYIHVRNLATGEVSGPLARGHAPTWSPAGDLIAFNEVGAYGRLAGILVMRPDGTGLRKVSVPAYTYDYSPRWSPDGKWIIACSNGRVHLIEVETGLTMGIPFLESILSVDWKPGALLP
ncbi:MAG: Ig-like domain-containing protein [Gemmatimonadetes bacterium]|nr:Ig-like domain-containing protein [Gemmatimonadota bacterium]